MKRIVAAIVVLVALGGWWTLEAVTGEQTKWAEVERSDLVLGVELTGTLEAVETVLLGPPQLPEMWQFKIAQMAPEGEDVEEGTPVVAFDASELHQRLQREIAERDAARKRVEKAEKERVVHRQASELSLAEARARLRKSKLKSERPDDLVADRDSETVRLDLELAEKEVAYLERRLESLRRSSEATLAALRDQLAQAEQQVEQTGKAIEEMVRKAPRSGTVVYVRNWRDEEKKVGDSCWRGEEVIELPDLNRMKAMGQVHEADAGKVAEGQRVTFRLDAHPDVEFVGRVRSIWRTVQRESWSSRLKVVRLEIELDETDTRRMRPGMRLRGKVETDRVDDAVVVPPDSVFLEPGGPVVYRRGFWGHETVRVELGRRNETQVEVLEGLDVGDSVALSDLERRARGS